MKCGSNQYLIKNYKLKLITSNSKDIKKNNQLKSKDIEKKIAAVREVDKSALQKYVSVI